MCISILWKCRFELQVDSSESALQTSQIPLTLVVPGLYLAWFRRPYHKGLRRWCHIGQVLGCGLGEADKIRCFFLFSVSTPFFSSLSFSSWCLAAAVEHEELERHAAGGVVSDQREQLRLLHPDLPGCLPHRLWPSWGWGPEDQVPQLVWGQQLQSPLWGQWHRGGRWHLLWQLYKWVSVQTRALAPAHPRGWLSQPRVTLPSYVPSSSVAALGVHTSAHQAQPLEESTFSCVATCLCLFEWGLAYLGYAVCLSNEWVIESQSPSFLGDTGERFPK